MSFTRHAFLRCLRCLISSAGLEGQVHFHWLVDDKTEYRARLLSSNQPSRTLRRDELAGCGVLPPPLPPLRIFLVPGTEIETLPVQGPRASFNHCQIRSNSARFAQVWPNSAKIAGQIGQIRGQHIGAAFHRAPHSGEIPAIVVDRATLCEQYIIRLSLDDCPAQT